MSELIEALKAQGVLDRIVEEFGESAISDITSFSESRFINSVEAMENKGYITSSEAVAIGQRYNNNKNIGGLVK